MPDTFSDDFYKKWEHLITTIEISDVPMRFIKEVVVHFVNDDTMIFDITEMLSDTSTVDKVEKEIEIFLEKNDKFIHNVDFVINIPAVADEINDKTQRLLNGD